jgi:hypothetical protein
MYLFLNQYDFDSIATVTSSPPYVDDDGDPAEAKISLHPFGRSRGMSRAQIMMSLDEADNLARHLWQVVTDARSGRYTEKE